MLADPRSRELDVLERLRLLCSSRGLQDLATELEALEELLRFDLAPLESELGGIAPGQTWVEQSARHLLGRGGKRLRPLCVALAARIGTGLDPQSRQLAVVAELIHNATLLHDDVVDLADARRGAPTARIEFGNAASIFAGDQLLIEALQRVRAAGVHGVLDPLLATIAEMIHAEALQLESRGSLETSSDLYFEIARGKSASLFRWALGAGARAGGLNAEQVECLETYGMHLGVSFQLIDDLLDLTGDQEETGKSLFSDLREGKMTYPLIVLLQREPALRGVLQRIAEGVGPAPDQLRQVNEQIERHQVTSECRALAMHYVESAKESIASLPAGHARSALELVAEANIHRQA